MKRTSERTDPLGAPRLDARDRARRDAEIKLILGWSLVGLLAIFGVVALSEKYGPKGYVVGPSPEEIQLDCEPIVEWISKVRRESGSFPDDLLPEHRARLDALPYQWSYGHDVVAILRVGDMADWPYPIYSFYWSSRDGWVMSCDNPAYTLEDVRPILEECGYYD